jgi:hypothetical protein
MAAAIGENRGSQKDLSINFFEHQNNLSELATNCGCDYVDRVPMQGEAKILQKGGVFDSYIAATDREQFIHSIPHCPPGQYKRMQQAEALFRYAPIFDRQTGKIMPLNPLPDGTSAHDWGVMNRF